MDDKEFEVHVKQIITAARRDDANEVVGEMLQEFGEKNYLAGQYSLIDTLRRELDIRDLRKLSKRLRTTDKSADAS